MSGSLFVSGQKCVDRKEDKYKVNVLSSPVEEIRDIKSQGTKWRSEGCRKIEIIKDIEIIKN